MSWPLSGDQRIAMMLLLCIVLIISPLAAAQNLSVDFSSAIAQEVSIQTELMLGNLSSPVPLPPSADGIPNYDSILRLAASMPPLPVTLGEPVVSDIKSDVIPPENSNESETENTSRHLDTRQDVLRV
ncbi:hypothetical protein ONS96_008657 [Cadophora gregata f. sp. sojae]|nr:hypothetical protein ONS96_008657 [Cadophora gregata f. sp. sojae]